MTPLDALTRWLHTQAAGRRLVLVNDLAGLVAWPGELPGERDAAAWTVVPALGDLDFRLRYEPLRHGDARVLVVRRRAEVFLADVEARAARRGLSVDLTPRFLLAAATGRSDWPAWIDGEAALVSEHFGPLVRLARRDAGSDDEALLLRAATGLDLTAPLDTADAWQALYERAGLLATLLRRRSPLAARLARWVSGQAAPTAWVDLDEPAAAARLVWLTAVLGPHVAQLEQVLPKLYPGARRLTGEDATAVARVAYRLARRNRKLAAAQLAQAEAVLAGPLREATVRTLGLTDPARAAQVLRRETRSGLLTLFALRTLLDAVAADEPLHQLVLEPDLDGLLARVDELSESRVVAANAQLLRALLRLDRARRRLTALLDETPPERCAEQTAALLVDTEVGTLETDLRLAARLLTRDAVSDPRWHPRPDTQRHKCAVRAWCHLVDLARQALDAWEERFAASLGVPPPSAERGPLRVAQVWDEVVEPLRREPDVRRVTVVLAAGLTWEAWERTVAPGLAARCDHHAQAALAQAPAAGEPSLRRALAGARWDEDWRRCEWRRLVALARPGLGLRHAARPPQALTALASEGCLSWVGASAGLRVVAVDLLAQAPCGLAPADHERRLAALGEALTGLVGARGDEAVVVVSTGGAVWCGESRTQALAGEVLAPRCVALAPEQAAGTATWHAVDESGRALCFARGRDRLTPSGKGPALAAGGLSPAELVVPVAVLTPVPAGDRSAVMVGALAAPDRVRSGEPTQALLACALAGGALAEVAELRLSVAPDTTVRCRAVPCHTTLDCDERRLVPLTFALELPPGETHAEVVLEASCRVGARSFRRRARCTVWHAEETAPARRTTLVTGVEESHGRVHR